MSDYQKVRRGQRLDYVWNIKDVPCADCGLRYPPYIMQFDHVRGEKEFNIGRGTSSGVSQERLDAEIAKCDIVCANCHAERTYGGKDAGQRWPMPMWERARLALVHEPKASNSPDSYRLATCVVCERPMVAMHHLWLDDGGLKKEIHLCHVCATDRYGAPTP